MFRKLRRRLRDMGTIKALCLGAEKYANADGQKAPGSEHFVLAALELPDGTARKAFERICIDKNGFHSAIAQQYQQALQSMGIELPEHAIAGADAPAMPRSAGIYQAQPSAQALMQKLSQRQALDANTPLLGAHVIMAAATAEYGVAARAFRVMGVDPVRLAEAAAAEISAMQ